MSLYDELGVGSDATPEELKKAYKNRSKQTHPDKEGGSQEEFQKVAHAYMVLSNPDKRKKYDRTGKEDGIDRTMDRIMGFVHQCISEFIGAKNIKTDNLVEFCKKKLIDAQKQNRNSIDEMQAEIKRFEEVKRRLGDDETNPFVMVINTNLKGLEKNIEGCKDLIKENDETFDFIEKFEYKTDEVPFFEQMGMLTDSRPNWMREMEGGNRLGFGG